MKNYEDRLASLSPEQRALLNLRLNRRQGELKNQTIQTGTGTNLYPLSFEQEQLWFLTQLDPRSPVHNLSHTFVLHGWLDVEALARSFDEIVRRHESLRTSFVERNGQPFQFVADANDFHRLSVVDLRHLPEAEHERRARELADAHSRQPFDLSRGPLMRATLVRLSAEKHFLLLTLHHIITDWWSFKTLYRELSLFYRAFSKGDSATLAELPIQYGDFAAWQRQWMQGEVLANLLSYWKRQLAGAPPLLDLPTDYTRPAVQTFHGKRHFFTLPESLLTAFESLSRRAHVTVFTALLAAFQTLLYRYTGQTDILVGTPSANRYRSELEPLIGFFLNTLVLRADFSRNPTFDELLAQMREVTVGAYAHQQLPFRKLVEELQPERSLSFMPVFQVNFIFLTSQAPASDSLAASQPLLALSDVTVKALEVETVASQLDLSLALEDRPDGLVGFLEYNTDLFQESTIARMVEHLRNLMEAIIAHPERRVSEFELLAETERRQLLLELNDTAAPYPDLCLQELFERQVERAPDAVALIHGDDALTYRQLDRRANQLAHYLKNLGVRPEVRVGLCVERSAQMVVCLLGILKAGGAYVPLDPAYPSERLVYLSADAQLSVILSDGRADKELHGAGAHCINLKREAREIAAESAERPANTARTDNCAYVIYTSGSTGQPKGVIGLHRGAVNRLSWMWDAYPFAAGEVCCQKTSLNFIDSISEIFGGLLQGIPTLLVDDAVLLNPGALIDTLAARQVTRLTLVPSLLRIILESDDDLQRRLPRLKYCVSSGEALAPELAQLFFERMPGSILINLYGSSEVSADVTCCELNGGGASARVSLGRPINNSECYILDAHGRPVPAGVYGELHVGGVGLARGYHRRPELTAERFVPHAFGQHPGARLYRTGDVARLLPDGQIEYAGRNDWQVKLRGFRIEPAEIEAALAQHPYVREVLVKVSAADAGGDKRLVVYLAAREGARVTQESGRALTIELRNYLERTLPDYMIPSLFILLERLPQTPNGKVDHGALPAPEPDAADASPATAHSELEQMIADIWKEVLKVESVGLDDNFFALGGHSLLIFQVHDRLRRKVTKELQMTEMFQYPTVSSMAKHLARAEQAEPNLAPLRADAEQSPR